MRDNRARELKRSISHMFAAMAGEGDGPRTRTRGGRTRAGAHLGDEVPTVARPPIFHTYYAGSLGIRFCASTLGGGEADQRSELGYYPLRPLYLGVLSMKNLRCANDCVPLATWGNPTPLHRPSLNKRGRRAARRPIARLLGETLKECTLWVFFVG